MNNKAFKLHADQKSSQSLPQAKMDDLASMNLQSAMLPCLESKSHMGTLSFFPLYLHSVEIKRLNSVILFDWFTPL